MIRFSPKPRIADHKERGACLLMLHFAQSDDDALPLRTDMSHFPG